MGVRDPNSEDLYQRSAASRLFGFCSFVGIVASIALLLNGAWPLALGALALSIGLGYAGYRCSGGSENPSLRR